MKCVKRLPAKDKGQKEVLDCRRGLKQLWLGYPTVLSRPETRNRRGLGQSCCLCCCCCCCCYHISQSLLIWCSLSHSLWPSCSLICCCCCSHSLLLFRFDQRSNAPPLLQPVATLSLVVGPLMCADSDSRQKQQWQNHQQQ